MITQIVEVSTCHLGRMYYLLPFLKNAKIAETVNKYVPGPDYKVEIEGKEPICFTVGQIFEIMVINRLFSLKSPMYHIGEWAEGTPIEQIYGIPSALLNDDRIGRFLDKIYPHLSTIDSQITLNIIKQFGIEFFQIHFDPSSFKVCGEYLPIAGKENVLNVTYGRDGKGKTDEKQVRFGIAIEENGLPLLGKAYDGNASDLEMHPEFLNELRKMLKTSSFLITVDSKFDTKENLSDIFIHKGFFLCAGFFPEHLKEDLLEKYSKQHEFERLDYTSKVDQKKPKHKRNYYKAFEINKTMKVLHSDGKEYEHEYRLIFIYSSIKAKAESASRERGIRKVREELNSLACWLNRGKDKEHKKVQKKLHEILSRPSSRFFKIDLTRKNKRYFLSYVMNEPVLEKEKALEGVYILKTNLPKNKYSLNTVLSLYKKQDHIEKRIADIKGPLQVAPIYLEKQERILSLFTIIVQALKIYNLIEREVQQAVQSRGKAIPILPENRLSERPKAETIFRIFDDHPINLITIRYKDGTSEIRLSPLSKKQKMLFEFIKRTPSDRRTFSRQIGVYKIKAHS